MRRVLIVDDEVLVRIGIKHSIAWEQNGFELIGEASDGKEALEMIQKLAPDIVILDINMPVLNGIEVLRELKEQKYKGKVIVLTCFNEIEYARIAMKYGASDYVLKTTLNTDELLNALPQVRPRTDCAAAGRITVFILFPDSTVPSACAFSSGNSIRQHRPTRRRVARCCHYRRIARCAGNAPHASGDSFIMTAFCKEL